MKTKVLFFLLAGCLLALAAWLVHVPNQAASLVQEPNLAQRLEIPEKYRETIHKGLEYLVKNQFKDGHWEGAGGKHPVAMTGLVGIALLMEKNGVRQRRDGRLAEVPEAKYSANIGKAADWLMDKSQAGRDGLIFSEHASETSRYMQGHGLATLFLVGARKQEKGVRREKLTEILTRAVKYIVKAQSTQGGWYHTSKVEGHDFDTISATVIQMQALQACENAGIPVPHEAIEHGKEYLNNALRKFQVAAKPVQSGQLADIAAGLACVWWPHVLKDCQTEIPVGRDIKFGRDELTHYYYAQAVLDRGGDTWSGYRTAVFDHLQSTQNKDGSWPAGDGISVGPVYATALWCAVLQLDNRSYPSMPEIEVTIK